MAPELDVGIRSEQVSSDDAGQIRFAARLMFKSRERAEISNVSLLVDGPQKLDVELPLLEGEFDISGMDGATGTVLGDVTFDSVSPLPPVYKARRTGGRVNIDVLWTPDSGQAAHGDYTATLVVEAEGEDSPLTSDTVRFTISSPTPTPTGTPTPTATATSTRTPTATPTRTRTPTATWTRIPTRTRIAKPSSTPISFGTATLTPTARATATHTSTATSVPIVAPTRTPTATPTPIPLATQTPVSDIAANLTRAHSPQPAAQATSDGAQADTAPAATRTPEIIVASVATALAPPQGNSMLAANSPSPTTTPASDFIQPVQVSASAPVAQPTISTDTPLVVRLYPTDPSRPLRIIVDPPPTVAPVQEPASNALTNRESAVEQDSVANWPSMMRIGGLLLFAIAGVAASALIAIWRRSRRAVIDGN